MTFLLLAAIDLVAPDGCAEQLRALETHAHYTVAIEKVDATWTATVTLPNGARVVHAPTCHEAARSASFIIATADDLAQPAPPAPAPPTVNRPMPPPRIEAIEPDFSFPQRAPKKVEPKPRRIDLVFGGGLRFGIASDPKLAIVSGVDITPWSGKWFRPSLRITGEYVPIDSDAKTVHADAYFGMRFEASFFRFVVEGLEVRPVSMGIQPGFYTPFRRGQVDWTLATRGRVEMKPMFIELEAGIVLSPDSTFHAEVMARTLFCVGAGFE